MPSSSNLPRITTGLNSLTKRCCSFLVVLSLTMATLGYPAGAAHAASRDADMLAVHRNFQVSLGHLPTGILGTGTLAGWIKRHPKASTEGGAAGVSAGAGAWIGAGIGIAAGGTAIAGALPVAAVAGTIGWLATHAIIKEVDKD